MVTKTIDGEGRLVIDRALANQTVTVEKIGESEYRIRLEAAIPERERWLLSNDAARESLERGLKQAAAGQYAPRKPDLEADAQIADRDVE